MMPKKMVLALSLLLAAHADEGQRAGGTPLIAVRRAHVIAFFPTVSPSELDHDKYGLNETLSDFQFYARKLRAPLDKDGIDFDEVYAKSFRVRVGTRTTLFHPRKITVGYYLVAPDKRSRIEYGVMTDSDLLQVAKEYFAPGTRGK